MGEEYRQLFRNSSLIAEDAEIGGNKHRKYKEAIPFSPIQVPFWKVSNNFDISSILPKTVASPINAASTSAVITFMTGGISIFFSRFSGNAFR